MIHKSKYKELGCERGRLKTSVSLVLNFLFLALVLPAHSSTLMEKVAEMDKSGMFSLPGDSASVRGEPILIEEGYYGFNIVEDHGIFYGVSMVDWPLDVRSIQGESDFPWVMDLTLKKVKIKIDAIIRFGSGDSGKLPTAILVQKGYRGYNIFRVSKYYYGLEQSKWPMDNRVLLEFIKSPTFTASDLDGARDRVDGILEGNESGVLGSPTLVKEGYKGFNIVRFGNQFYIINQAEGPLNIWEIKNKAKYPWDIAKSLEKAQVKVDELISKSPFKTKVKFWLKSFLS